MFKKRERIPTQDELAQRGKAWAEKMEEKLDQVEAETGYRPVGMGPGSFTAYLQKCAACGAVILDREVHTAWHEQVVTRTVLIEAINGVIGRSYEP